MPDPRPPFPPGPSPQPPMSIELTGTLWVQPDEIVLRDPDVFPNYYRLDFRDRPELADMVRRLGPTDRVWLRGDDLGYVNSYITIVVVRELRVFPTPPPVPPEPPRAA